MQAKNFTLITTVYILSFFLIRGEVTGQNIYTVAGTGTSGFSGDGGVATSAKLDLPLGVAVDASGNVFIADRSNHRVRKVSASGIISTIAGTGTGGYSGDGGAGSLAKLFYPYGVATDASGNIYIADNSNHRIRKVNASTGIISTVAGIGTGGSSGDGGAATSAQLSSPTGAVVDASGNIYIADMSNNKIRKVDASTGIITTVAGTGTSGFAGDGGPAASAQFSSPWSLALDASGNLFIADVYNNRIRKINSLGMISTVAGVGTAGFSGDGGTATAAELKNPYGVAVDASGNIYIADKENSRIRMVDALGIISTVAGTGTAGYNGDGIAATSANLKEPTGVAVDAGACLFIADYLNHRIRKVIAGACADPNAVELLSSVDGNLDILNIYPNPASGNMLTALVVTEKSTSAKAEVLNAIGQVMYKKDIDLQKGETEIKVPIATWASGQYLLRITLSTQEKAQRVFVK